jgi:hypothetical protein
MLTRKVVKQGSDAPMLKSSLKNLCCRHHDLIDGYKISIFQMVMDLFIPSYHLQDVHRTFTMICICNLYV